MNRVYSKRIECDSIWMECVLYEHYVRGNVMEMSFSTRIE